MFRKLFPALLLVVAVFPLQAQEDVASMALSELQERASTEVQNQNFAAARPFLEELVERFKGDAQMREQIEGVYFFIAVSYLQEYSQSPRPQLLEQAIEGFDRYEQEFPQGGRLHLAILNRADARRGLGRWEAAAADLERVLEPPHVNQLSREARMEALEKIVQAYYIAKNWEQGIPFFKDLLDRARNQERRAQAAAALMEAYINRDEFEQALGLLPMLSGGTDARYSLQFNVALIEAGDRLAEEERYNEASLIYNLVLSIDEIRTYLRNKISGLDRRLERLRVSEPEDGQRTTEVTTESWRPRLEAVGSVVAVNGIDVSTEVAGKVSRVAFESAGRSLHLEPESAHRPQLPAHGPGLRGLLGLPAPDRRLRAAVPQLRG